MSPFCGCGGILWRIIPLVILWSVCKERNDGIFRSFSMVVKDIVHLVSMQIAKWVSSKKEFDDLWVDGVLFNWEVSLYSAASKVRKMDFWVPPSQGV